MEKSNEGGQTRRRENEKRRRAEIEEGAGKRGGAQGERRKKRAYLCKSENSHVGVVEIARRRRLVREESAAQGLVRLRHHARLATTAADFRTGEKEHNGVRVGV